MSLDVRQPEMNEKFAAGLDLGGVEGGLVRAGARPTGPRGHHTRAGPDGVKTYGYTARGQLGTMALSVEGEVFTGKLDNDDLGRVSAITSNYDAVIMPTCAVVAPTLEEVSTPEGFTRKNNLLLRNTTVGNFLDRCSISLPCHAAGELPVGFMLMAEAMADRRLLAISRSVAPVVAAH